MKDLYVEKNDDVFLTSKAVALLLGVTESEVRQVAEVSGPHVTHLPKPWVRQGRRIARETMAKLGTDSMKECLEYLASQQEQVV